MVASALGSGCAGVASSAPNTVMLSLAVAAPAPATVQIRAQSGKTILTKRLRPGAVIRARVTPGAHEVLVVGSGPLERYIQRIVVNGPTERTIDIQKIPAALRVSGGKRRGITRVKLAHGYTGAQATLVSDAEGRIPVDVWQAGPFAVSVELPDGSWFITHVEITEATELPVVISGIRVFGSVVSSVPISDAIVHLLSSEPDSAGARTARTDVDGKFNFEHVQPGTHTIRVIAEKHLPAEQQVKIASGDIDRQILMSLEPSVRHRIVVRDEEGRPQAATIFDEKQAWPIGKTNANGESILDLRAGQQKNIFVMSNTRSFTTATISPSDSSAIITLPRADAHLEVTTAAAQSMEPIPRVPFLVKYNGALLPRHVLQWLQRTQDVDFTTGLDGRARVNGVPRGRYELWPALTEAEVRAALSGQPAPVRIDATAGRHTAVLTFLPAQ